MNSFDKDKHISHIDESIQELKLLTKRTGEPNSEPHQFIGTIADCVIGLLCASANSLDIQQRTFHIKPDSHWLNFMKIVHRTFLTLTKEEAEHGIIIICKKANLDCCASKPKLMDWVNLLLNNLNMKEIDKREWRNFFECLRILRNKAAHYDQSLDSTEIKYFEAGCCNLFLTKNNTIQFNTKYYFQVFNNILNFFDIAENQLFNRKK